MKLRRAKKKLIDNDDEHFVSLRSLSLLSLTSPSTPTSLSSLQTIFTTRPELARALGLGSFCGGKSGASSGQSPPHLHLHPHVRPRLARMSPAATRVRSLRAPAIGRLVSVTGTVVRASGVRPLPTAVTFECAACGSAARVPLDAGRWPAAPGACGGRGGSCRGRRFFPDLSSAEAVDWQRLRLQDLPVDGAGGEANAEGGSGGGGDGDDDAPGAAPAAIDVDVSADLVASCAPGDVVTVVGLVRVCAASSSSAGAGAANSKAGLYVAYLDAVSVERANGNGGGGSSSMAGPDSLGLLGAPSGANEEDATANDCTIDGEEGEQQGDAPSGAASFSRRDLAFVVKFLSEVGRQPGSPGGGAFRHLVHALAPGVYGHEMVKAALVLALFGGVGSEQKENKKKKNKKKKDKKGRRMHEDESADDADDAGGESSDDPSSSSPAAPPRRRSEIHVLLCGDPGLGKSQLLRAAAAAAPRGVFVCGAAASAAGLTASVGRDAATGRATLEAGALALADRGACCVDEFDKLAADPSSLLSALEQQEVVVAKAGVLARLPARAALLAAANPAGGSHDPSRTLAENVALPRALLSRFDLVFLLEDRPAPSADAALAAHVLALASGAGAAGARAAAKAALALGGGGGGAPMRLPPPGESRQQRRLCSSPLQQQPFLLSLPPPASQATPGGGWAGEKETQQLRSQRKQRWRQQQQQQRERGGNGGGGGETSSPSSLPSLAERLATPFPADADPIPRELFRVYCAYARAHCHPRLSAEARRSLRGSYLAMREAAEAQGARHVTPRALESLARLAEARARVDLRGVVTGADAEDAAELAGAALGVGGGGGGVAACGWGAAAGEIARSNSGNGRGRAAARAEAERFLAAAARAAVAKSSDVFAAGELCALADAIDLDVTDVPQLLERLNEQGELLKRGGGAYSVARARAAISRAGERQGAYNDKNENSRPLF